MTNKAISVYAKALRRKQQEEIGKSSSPRIGVSDNKRQPERKTGSPRNRDTTKSRHHATTVSRYHDTIIERVRKAVKDFVRTTSGPISFEGCQLCEEQEGGTLVTQNIEGEVGGFFKVAEGVVANQLESSLQRDFENLKAILEG